MMSPEPLHVHVNGEPREVPAGTTVASLVASLGLGSGPYAVERNRAIVPRSRHAEQALADGDRLEIVGFVGGG